jgi:diacylglycerol kinase (ATP)
MEMHMGKSASKTGQRVVLIANPISGRKRVARVEMMARELDGPWSLEVVETRRSGDARRAAGSLSDDTVLVVAAGGDGTVNEVISGLSKRNIPVAIVPLGTANVLAKEFGIPRDIKGACEVARLGRWRSVDLGVSDRGYFLAVAGVGFDAAVVREFSRFRTGNASLASYLDPIWRIVQTYRFPSITVTVDGRVISEAATSVIVANTRSYGGPFVVAPRARPDDGFLDVCVFTAADAALQAVYMAASVLEGHTLLPGVETLRARSVSCESGKRVPVQLDGDRRGSLPVSFSVEPSAIRLVVP